MDTDIDDPIYIFNDGGTFIKFNYKQNKLYYLYIRREDKEAKYFFSTVKGMEIKYSELDQKRVEAVRNLQEWLGFPSDVHLANAIEYNVLGMCLYNKRDIGIAKKVDGKV